MKNFFFVCIICTGLGVTTVRAQDSQRPSSTDIATLLAAMPAVQQQQFSRNAASIAALGEKGLEEMALMLKPDAEGENASLLYAISGFSNYVTQPGKEAWRSMSVTAYCSALEKMTDKDNQAFIIRQLQKVGDDKAVPCLQRFLADETLCDPAARALVTIHTPAAEDALLQALQGASAATRLSLVEALGDCRYKKAAPAVSSLVQSDDQTLRKVSLYALANIADPSSKDILADAAAKSGYTFDPTDATAAYLLYAHRLIQEGHEKQARKIAKRLIKKCKGGHQQHTLTAAKKLMEDARK